ncbi:hypothetical protein NHX12_002548 [Muraenolepis orangiensis]|uniref:Spermatogenesis-associated protein 2 PUB-like domain-containing protein n=1 Tax=Muraenolepis orangiensis TaxID=630683 RepID=A0A9Q0IEU3_9TELE|nr:hypothetical protein NHX12_002548 [Muraenolepis orangiensis]
MSIHCQIANDLVKKYDHCLEQRLVEGASSLTCHDEVLRKHAEAILENGGAEDILGLDPLKVMEESLKAMVDLPVSTARPCRGGLRGLAKAFEVLEQAALNLYLNPWREEYKVVKMYSGIFTHSIKPVLSMAQIGHLFGLLGYQPCLGQHEQLLRGRSGVHSASPSHLLQLSCGFFLARCECQLLLAALGNHGGEVDWELGLVMERRRGHSLQVSLDNSKKLLDTNQALTEEVSDECGAGGELELDLYTAGGLKSGRGETAGFQDDHAGPRSLSWVANHGVRSPASMLLGHSNGFANPTSSSTTAAAATSPLAREPRCVSTLNCQLTNASLSRQIPSGATRTAAATPTQVAAPEEEPQSHRRFDRNEDWPSIAMAQASGLTSSEDSLPPSPEHLCSCVQSSGASPHLNCLNCNTLHNTTCPSLQKCHTNGHSVTNGHKATEVNGKTRPLSSQGLGEPAWSIHPNHTADNVAMSLSCMPDFNTKPPQPMTYHSCCVQAPDPLFVCFTCQDFHSGACREVTRCETLGHDTKPLQVCECGMLCSRSPLVLCRYCGREYCSKCWYRTPVICACGETFDHRPSD